MKKKERSRILAGIILILLGLFLAGNNKFIGFDQGSILLLIGGIFIAWYFYSNSYGLLIPGCTLAGLGLSLLGGHYFWNSPYNSSLGIGVGFIAVYLIHLFNNGKAHWWPLIPGGILVLSALSHGAFGVKDASHFIWPVILIVLGIWIIGKSTGLIKKEDAESEDEEPSNQKK